MTNLNDRTIVISERDMNTGELTTLDEFTLMPGISMDSNEARTWSKWWLKDKTWILRMAGTVLRHKYQNAVQGK